MIERLHASKMRGIAVFLHTLILGMGLLFASNLHAEMHGHIKIGVLAFRGGDVALKRWTPLAEYLTRRIPGYHFSIVPLNLAETHNVITRKQIDFLLTNPGNS